VFYSLVDDDEPLSHTLSYFSPPLKSEIFIFNRARAAAFGRGLRHLNICEPLSLEKSLEITENFDKFDTSFNPFQPKDEASTSVQFDSRKKTNNNNKVGNGHGDDASLSSSSKVPSSNTHTKEKKQQGVGNCLLIYDKCSVDWMMVWLACLKESIAVIVLHHSSSLETVQEVVNQCGASAIL
jgi:hypothetical protein